MSLSEWGWTGVGLSLEPGYAPARVIGVHRELYVVHDGVAEQCVEASGRLLHEVSSPSGLPAVGDWVSLRSGVLDSVLPRRTVLSRKAAGTGLAQQVLAANVDLIFVVSGLDGDLNLRRLERYLVVAAESGAEPVIVLNKADLCSDPMNVAAEVRRSAGGRRVLVVSARRDPSVESIRELLEAGRTGAMLGSSGAGKSTLLNRLLGQDVQRVKEVTVSDGRGQHTTTHRQLFRVPSGGMLIDQPGLREVQLWAGQEALAGAFEDLSELGAKCKFRDCRHQGEPGCAVTEAVETGEIDPRRVMSYEKLRREIERLEEDVPARLKRKRADKSIHKAMRRFTKQPR